MMVVPEPMKRSTTVSPFIEQSRSASATRATGLTVGCSAKSCRRPDLKLLAAYNRPMVNHDGKTVVRQRGGAPARWASRDSHNGYVRYFDSTGNVGEATGRI